MLWENHGTWSHIIDTSRTQFERVKFSVEPSALKTRLTKVIVRADLVVAMPNPHFAILRQPYEQYFSCAIPLQSILNGTSNYTQSCSSVQEPVVLVHFWRISAFHVLDKILNFLRLKTFNMEWIRILCTSMQKEGGDYVPDARRRCALAEIHSLLLEGLGFEPSATC